MCKIFALSDLHLSFFKPKPMDIFGQNWSEHVMKIKMNWEAIVSDDDYVLISGDISWALKLAEAMEDLAFIQKLPGKKILLNGKEVSTIPILENNSTNEVEVTMG